MSHSFGILDSCLSSHADTPPPLSQLTSDLLVPSSSCSEPGQPPEGLHAGGVHRHRPGGLLVCLYPESLLQGAHEQDDEGSGQFAEGRAELA